MAAGFNESPNQQATRLFYAAVASFTRNTPEGRTFVLCHSVLAALDEPIGQPDDTVFNILWSSALGNARLRVQPKTSCRLVFCILMELGATDLLQCFDDHGSNDDSLPLSRQDLSRCLNHRAEPFAGDSLGNTLLSSFYAAQFRWKPVELAYGLRLSLSSTMILPICHKEAIKSQRESGNPALHWSATLWKVQVPEQFVSQTIQQDLPQARKPTSGHSSEAVFEFALKQYSDNSLGQFDNECQIYDILGPAEGFIRYIASYEDKTERENRSGNQIHGIILELGQYDLLSGLQMKPPETPNDIRAYWQAVSTVARGLASVHQVHKDGVLYLGWHGDVKPANIIFVQHPHQHYKLADPADAVLRQSKLSPNVPRVVLSAYSKTYGCPEFDDILGQSSPVTQACDVWSLGCVLSVVATFILLGSEGVSKYAKARHEASERRTGFAGDIFHDGKGVLPEVLQWHETLRSSSLRDDRWSRQILDFVDRYMLVAAEDRLSAMEIFLALKDIVFGASGVTEQDHVVTAS